MPSESLTTIAGPMGVGAICMLGVFLFLDGQSPDLFPTVETYASSATWGVVAAIPILVMAYVLGLCLSSAGTLFVAQIGGVGEEAEAADIVSIASMAADKSAAVLHYLQLRQDRAVLAGSSIAIVFLAAGAFSEIANLPTMKWAVVTLAVGSLALALTLMWLAARKTTEAHQLVLQVIEQARRGLPVANGSSLTAPMNK